MKVKHDGLNEAKNKGNVIIHQNDLDVLMFIMTFNHDAILHDKDQPTREWAVIAEPDKNEEDLEKSLSVWGFPYVLVSPLKEPLCWELRCG